MPDFRRAKLLSIGLVIPLLGCAPPPLSSGANNPEPIAAPEIAQPTAPSAISSAQSLPLSAQFAASEQIIQLEVAQTPRQQEIGLMFRTQLAADRGMLFPFEPPRPVQFWMRNTLIPLDMVFLLDGQVKAIAANAPPCTTAVCPTYGSNVDVNQVIELRGGRAAELGLEVGQQLNIRAIQPTPQTNSSN